MRGSFLKGATVGFVCAVLGGATVSLAGNGIGGVFNLGVSNSVDAKTTLNGSTATPQLQVTNTNTTAGAAGLGVNSASASPTIATKNTAGGPAAAITVNAGVTPFTVNSQTRVANLNADLLDGFNSTGFLRNQVPLALTGATSTNGVIVGTNTGTANGVQGKTAGSGASGVYGENTNGGFGVAGRSNAPPGLLKAAVYGEGTAGGIAVLGVSNQSLGIGVEGRGSDFGVFGSSSNAAGAGVEGQSTGTGPGGRLFAGSGAPAIDLHAAPGVAPITVDSSVKVAKLNADKVDGASIVSNRIISTTLNDHIIQLPGFGDFNVVSCDHTNARFEWSSGGPLAYVTWYDVFSGDNTQAVANLVTSVARPRHFATVQLARDTGAGTSIATVTVTTNGADCVFAAQAVVQPG
jgi:hypothetical protein